MLWAVPAKSPVAPRALAVLAFFLLLTLYLTWPLPVPSIYSSASPWVGRRPCGAKYSGFCAGFQGRLSC